MRRIEPLDCGHKAKPPSGLLTFTVWVGSFGVGCYILWEGAQFVAGLL